MDDFRNGLALCKILQEAALPQPSQAGTKHHGIKGGTVDEAALV